MTHKQTCIHYCMQHLEELELSNIFSSSTFEHYYRKNKGSQGNAYYVGLHACDMMLRDYIPIIL